MDLLFLLEQQGRKIDLVSGDKLLTELNENILAVDCAEQLVCRPVVQLFWRFSMNKPLVLPGVNKKPWQIKPPSIE